LVAKRFLFAGWDRPGQANQLSAGREAGLSSLFKLPNRLKIRLAGGFDLKIPKPGLNFPKNGIDKINFQL
jgi:hypothetical protein